MKIEKALKAKKIQFALNYSIILSLSSFGFSLFLSYWFLTYMSIVFFILYIFLFLRDYNYFFYSDDDKKKIVIRFFGLRNVFKIKRKSYEIHKVKINNYKIEKKSLKKEIIFFQKTENEIFEYPAVNISILSSEEINKMEKSINQIINNKKK